MVSYKLTNSSSQSVGSMLMRSTTLHPAPCLRSSSDCW